MVLPFMKIRNDREGVSNRKEYMNGLIEKNIVKEYMNGVAVFYTFKDSSYFSTTDYKIIKNEKQIAILKCSDFMYNGKREIVFFVNKYKSLLEIINEKKEHESLNNIIFKIIENVLKIKSNGFLTYSNLILSFDRIFVGKSDYDCKLIYLPVANSSDNRDNELEFRERIAEYISDDNSFYTYSIEKIKEDLADGEVELEDIYNKMCEIYESRTVSNDVIKHPVMVIKSEDSDKALCFETEADEFIIGKKQGAADFVISGVATISRRHCKIIYEAGVYYIEDIGSTNGTYLNDFRLEPHIREVIGNGDTIKLATSKFIIELKEG